MDTTQELIKIAQAQLEFLKVVSKLIDKLI